MLTGRSVVLDYMKFRPKPAGDLAPFLAGTPSLFLIACTSCFRPGGGGDPGCPDIRRVIAECGTAVGGCLEVDFLCNRRRTGALLAGHACRTKDVVGVYSCGIGIQTVAEILEGTRVVALADSIPHGGNATTDVAYHGVSLRPVQCAACGQCRLEQTAGICPVVECAKSLLNGPCGGAKNGRCEVNPELVCAWEKIHSRLASQRRPGAHQVQVHTFNAFGPDKKAELSASVVKKRTEGFPGGLYPQDEKDQAAGIALTRFPDPQRAVVFLSQHTGAPARPVVKKGDRVRTGQEIGETTGVISSPVHAPISGIVAGISEQFHPSLRVPMPAIVIENDGSHPEPVLLPPLRDWQDADPAVLRERIRRAGVVGLGGAMFPASVKLNPPRPVDTLILNGCECEPILSADNRMMIEHPADIVEGAQILRRILGVQRCFVAVEENKPEAISALSQACGNADGISVVPVKTKYPQGAERMLILRVTGRRVPEGKLPFDAGVVVFNVSTAAAVCRAVRDGVPLVERPVTVAGAGIARPANFVVKIGTPFADILRACGPEERYRLIMGGPMMGILQPSWDGAVIKGTTGLCLLPPPVIEPSDERDCIRCGRCVDACPMDLVPSRYAFHGKRQEWATVMEHGVSACIECGCCEYICSSKIALVSLIRKGKMHARHIAEKS